MPDDYASMARKMLDLTTPPQGNGAVKADRSRRFEQSGPARYNLSTQSGLGPGWPLGLGMMQGGAELPVGSGQAFVQGHVLPWASPGAYGGVAPMLRDADKRLVGGMRWGF